MYTIFREDVRLVINSKGRRDRDGSVTSLKSFVVFCRAPVNILSTSAGNFLQRNMLLELTQGKLLVNG